MVEICKAAIESISTYSPSRRHEEPKLEGEQHDAYDIRTWRMHAHTNKDGEVIIPFMAFKKALDAAAKLTPRKIAGRGQQTYSQQMKSGVLMDAPLPLSITRDELKEEAFWCSATGDSRGLGQRVLRRFPMIEEWGGDLTFYITNPTIQKDVFETYLREAGMFIGIGRFRPEVGGVNGRFKVKKVAWSSMS